MEKAFKRFLSKIFTNHTYSDKCPEYLLTKEIYELKKQVRVLQEIIILQDQQKDLHG